MKGVKMIPANIISDLRKMDRVDKLRVMQFLIIELAKDEGALLKAGTEYPIWSPYNSYQAAHTLLNLLKANPEKPRNA